ncbi:unnamed protein product, partial [Vitis vinifera]
MSFCILKFCCSPTLVGPASGSSSSSSSSPSAKLEPWLEYLQTYDYINQTLKKLLTQCTETTPSHHLLELLKIHLPISIFIHLHYHSLATRDLPGVLDKRTREFRRLYRRKILCKKVGIWLGKNWSMWPNGTKKKKMEKKKKLKLHANWAEPRLVLLQTIQHSLDISTAQAQAQVQPT